MGVIGGWEADDDAGKKRFESGTSEWRGCGAGGRTRHPSAALTLPQTPNPRNSSHPVVHPSFGPAHLLLICIFLTLILHQPHRRPCTHSTLPSLGSSPGSSLGPSKFAIVLPLAAWFPPPPAKQTARIVAEHSAVPELRPDHSLNTRFSDCHRERERDRELDPLLPTWCYQDGRTARWVSSCLARGPRRPGTRKTIPTVASDKKAE